MKELFKLRLAEMTMEEYERRFLELLTYVGFIQYDKFKIYRFISGLTTYYQDKITYDEPCTLKETKRKDKCLHEENKEK